MPWPPHLPWLSSEPPNVPPNVVLTSPDANAVLDALAAHQAAQDALEQAQAQLAQALRNWSRRPVKLSIWIDGKEPTQDMAEVNDVSFIASVVAEDAAGRQTSDANPFRWTLDPADAATLAPDPEAPTDTSHVQVNVTPADAQGNQANFTLQVTDGTLTGSEDCEPTPGAATRLVIRP